MKLMGGTGGVIGNGPGASPQEVMRGFQFGSPGFLSTVADKVVVTLKSAIYSVRVCVCVPLSLSVCISLRLSVPLSGISVMSVFRFVFPSASLYFCLCCVSISVSVVSLFLSLLYLYFCLCCICISVSVVSVFLSLLYLYFCLCCVCLCACHSVHLYFLPVHPSLCLLRFSLNSMLWFNPGSITP